MPASPRANGDLQSVNHDGMQIQHNLRGGRVIVSEHNGDRIVSMDAGRGFVQRAYVTRGGRSYYSRTYYDGKAYRVGIYRDYAYGGHRYYGYYPGYWYHPSYYGWAYRRWDRPVPWAVGMGGWGWAGAPWFRYYGGYFAPYPVYSSAAFWLTDYLIAADLQAAYAARAEANADEAAGYDQEQAEYANGELSASNSGSPTLSADVKQAIADEVKAQLAEEQRQSSSEQSGDLSDGTSPAPAPASSDVPPALDPARRTFVVFSDLTVTSDGQECELTAGDILTRVSDTPDANQNVTAKVSARRKKDCATDQLVVISVEQLQEMRNHFDEQVDTGLKALAQKQGTGGLPKAPDTGTTASAVPLPPPDTTAAKALTNEEAEADKNQTPIEQQTAEGQVVSQGEQGTSLGAFARQLRARKQQNQAQTDSSQTQDSDH